MDWIYRFDLFLFDFDGLLVDTENLHYKAYLQMLANEGCEGEWTFQQFCKAAHLNATALKESIYQKWPELDPDWARLYREKKRLYQALIEKGEIDLMPGAAPLLEALKKAGIERCVVTNSSQEQIHTIRSHLPALQTIPHWITREHYEKPKPDSECYLKAIQLYQKKGGKAIGFEDSLRGLEALLGTPALPVFICPKTHPLFKQRPPSRALVFDTLAHVIVSA